MRLEGKVCVVTGGSSGIGEAIAQAFDREGAHVIILDIDGVAAATVAAGLKDAIAIECNVANSHAVDEAFIQVISRWSRVDVLVNNAGIVGKDEYRRAQASRELQLEEQRAGKAVTPLRVTINLSDEQWERMIAVHLHGTFFCTRAALRAMEHQGSGVIINMSSINGIDGGQGNPHYAAAKAGILGFTRSIAKELISQGIRVNAVAPGFIQTSLRDTIRPGIQKVQIAATPIGRAGTPAEVADVMVFLASDASSYVVGQTISPNGGYITH